MEKERATGKGEERGRGFEDLTLLVPVVWCCVYKWIKKVGFFLVNGCNLYKLNMELLLSIII